MVGEDYINCFYGNPSALRYYTDEELKNVTKRLAAIWKEKEEYYGEPTIEEIMEAVRYYYPEEVKK